MNIEVVLTQDDPKLGKRGDIVKVSSGFAQNFLFPHQKAKPATDANVASYKAERSRAVKEESERLERARALSQKLSTMSVTIEAAAGEGEKLFGAVTAADVAQALAKQGIVLDKKEIHLEEPIKKIGAHQVQVKLHGVGPQFIAPVHLKIQVVARKNA